MWITQEHTLFLYRSQRSSEIVSRLFIDLRRFDLQFMRKCEEIFQINERLDRVGGQMLRDYLDITISEIVSLYSMNPSTIMGTLNIGADFRQYPGLIDQPEEIQEEFNHAYKLFAVRMTEVLTDYLEEYRDKAIDMGYSDVSCSVARYVPGSLLLNMRGIMPFPDR